MILGPIESYELLLRTGKGINSSSRDMQKTAYPNAALLSLPHFAADQQTVLDQPPRMSKDILKVLHSLGLVRVKYNCVVNDVNNRRNSKYLSCLVFDKSVPDRSILQIANDIYVLSPALCLLLLARKGRIGDEQLVFAISQLCSRYAYSIGPEPELVERVPLTSTARINAYLESMKTLNTKRMPKGIARLERLLPYALDATRSPYEIASGLMMQWPDQGLGLCVPRFEVNKRIALTEQEQKELDKSYLESDFVWEEERTIIEYNGGVHADQREEDSARTNVLRDKGYRVEILTYRVLGNCESYLKFMHRLEETLGFKVPTTANELNWFRAFHDRVLDIANKDGSLSSA